jgi:nitrogen fixation NifU-like protein
MPDLRELYQEVILEHSKAPRNYRELATANHRAEGYNPLCGDHFTVYLDLEGDSIRDISFQGSGCAISQASASLMTQSVKGKTRAEAARLFDQFHKLVTGQSPANGNRVELGKLAVFSGVSEFPVRSSAQPLPGTHCTLQCKGNRKRCRRSSTRRGEEEM